MIHKREVFFAIDKVVYNSKKGMKHDFFTKEELIQKTIKHCNQIKTHRLGCSAYADWKIKELKEFL